MSGGRTLADVMNVGGHVGLVVALAWAAPRLIMAITHALTVTIALMHPDKVRRAEAVRLLHRSPRPDR